MRFTLIRFFKDIVQHIDACPKCFISISKNIKLSTIQNICKCFQNMLPVFQKTYVSVFKTCYQCFKHVIGNSSSSCYFLLSALAWAGEGCQSILNVSMEASSHDSLPNKKRSKYNNNINIIIYVVFCLNMLFSN